MNSRTHAAMDGLVDVILSVAHHAQEPSNDAQRKHGLQEEESPH